MLFGLFFFITLKTVTYIDIHTHSFMFNGRSVEVQMFFEGFRGLLENFNKQAAS